MAIDTENKRRSVSGYGGAKVAPAPDGTIEDADRYHMGWIYAGTTPSGGGGGGFQSAWAIQSNVFINHHISVGP